MEKVMQCMPEAMKRAGVELKWIAGMVYRARKAVVLAEKRVGGRYELIWRWDIGARKQTITLLRWRCSDA